MLPPAPAASGSRPAIHAPLLLGAALLLRLALAGAAFAQAQGTRVFETADSGEYLRLANSLSSTGTFRREGSPELYRPPGYPVLLTVALALGQGLGGVVVVQALLACLTVWLVYRCTELLTGEPRAALASGLLAAVEPVGLALTCLIMAETLLACCVVTGVYGLVRFGRGGGVAWLALAGASAAAAAYAKPVAYFLPLCLAGLVAALDPRPSRWPRRGGAALLLLIISAALLAPWHARNLRSAGYRGFSTQIDGYVSLSGPAAAIAAAEGRPFSEVRAEFDEYRTGVREPGAYDRGSDHGIRTIFLRWPDYARAHLAGMVRTLTNPGAIPLLVLFGLHPAQGGVGAMVLDQGSLAAWHQARSVAPMVFWTTLALGALLIPYLVLPALALCRRGQPDRRWRVALALLAGYFVVLGGGPWGQSRFRHPAMPILCILAGFEVARAVRSRVVKAGHAA